MIFESAKERMAFEFVCDLANRETDRHGCNDLSHEELEMFGILEAESWDPYDKKMIQRTVTNDFDVIHWLKKQVKVPQIPEEDVS